jgi:hypothetical protein
MKKKLNEIPCIHCDWKPSDIPNVDHCTVCIMTRLWIEFDKAYSYGIRHEK